MEVQDWMDVWKVKRDICFLYHDISEYAGIPGDWAYGSLYQMPYWKFLELEGFQMPDDERTFIRSGCLIMILAMAWDLIDGSGSYLREYLPECCTYVSLMNCQDDDLETLKRAVLLALETAEANRKASDELDALSVWANQRYILGYFQAKLTESLESLMSVTAAKVHRLRSNFMPQVSE